jgi:hypothetical protein
LLPDRISRESQDNNNVTDVRCAQTRESVSEQRLTVELKQLLWFSHARRLSRRQDYGTDLQSFSGCHSAGSWQKTEFNLVVVNNKMSRRREVFGGDGTLIYLAELAEYTAILAQIEDRSPSLTASSFSRKLGHYWRSSRDGTSTG